MADDEREQASKPDATKVGEGDRTTDRAEPRDSTSTITRYLIPTLVTLFLGVATFWMDSRISERADKEQSARLYTQLISDREQATTSLRKDMFATILGGILADATGEPPAGSKSLDNQLLKLELLALNFGETLSLGPLFAMMDRRIRTDASYATKLERLDRLNFDWRMASLARRVADAQRGAVAGDAVSFVVKVPSDRVGEVGTFTWPDVGESERVACLMLDGIQRRFELIFENLNMEAKTIDVSLGWSTYKLAAEAPERCREGFAECAGLETACVEHLSTHSQEQTQPFTIDRYNLPLIDNSLLSDDQRFALVVRDFSEDTIDVLGILFPGQYAGRQDKLTLDQAIEALQGRLQ